MTLKDKAKESGLFVIGENSIHLGIAYATLICTTPHIDIYKGCEYAAFNDNEECIAVGNEKDGSGMSQSGGWTWIRNKMDNRYVKSDTPPINAVVVKLGYLSTFYEGGKLSEYYDRQREEEKVKNPWRWAWPI